MRGSNYRIPESLSAFCNIVSLTAAKTSRMFVVSVACVRLVLYQHSLSVSEDWGLTEGIH